MALLLSADEQIVAIPLQVRSDRGTETIETFAVHKAFHEHSHQGDVDGCWKYGRSVHNQKIECFWSHMIVQWLSDWQGVFRDLEWSDLWELNNEYDKIALVYIYMPIIQRQLRMYRRDYNAYPMRYNHLSRLPHGPPEDNYFLPTRCGVEFSVEIDPTWVESVRLHNLNGFYPEQYLDAAAAEELDEIMRQSPFGTMVNARNARAQYVYLRGILRNRN